MTLLYLWLWEPGRYHGDTMHMSLGSDADAPQPQTRRIAIELTEAEWRAFVTLQPRPVDWLKERIREQIERGRESAGH